MAKKTKKKAKKKRPRTKTKKVSESLEPPEKLNEAKKKKKTGRRGFFNKENATEYGRKGGLKGRGPQFTTFLRHAIFGKDGQLTKDGKDILAAAVAVSKKGNVQMIKEVFSRMDGNVPNKIEAQIDHGVLTDLTDDDLASIVGTDPEDADS